MVMPATFLQPPTLAQVCEKALRLPCAPSLMPQLIAVLQDSNCGAAEVEGIIRVDPALAASTLRLANSAFYSGGSPVPTLGIAIMRLGQREIFRLAALALINRWESAASGSAYRGDSGDFSRHALCTAIAAEAIAEVGERVDAQLAYTAGLISDMGKLAVAHACGQYFPSIRSHLAAQGGSWIAAERAVLGYDQSETGAQLLRTWNFPPELVATAEFVHHPARSPESLQPMLAVVHAAKFLATSFGPGVAEDGFLFVLDEDFLARYNLSPELLEEMLPIVLERATARLRDKLTHGPVAF